MAAVSPLSSPHASPSQDATLTQALPSASLALAWLRLSPVVLGPGPPRVPNAQPGEGGGALEGYFSRVSGLVWLKCALFADASAAVKDLAPCWPPTRPPGLPPAFRALSPPQGDPRGAHRRLPARLEGRPRRHRPPVQQLGGPGRGCGSCRRAKVSGPSPCPASPSLSPPFLLAAGAWAPQARGGSPFGRVWSQPDLGPSELPVGRIPAAAGGCPLPLVSELREGRPTASLSLIRGCLERGEVGRRGHRVRAGPPGHCLLL